MSDATDVATLVVNAYPSVALCVVVMTDNPAELIDASVAVGVAGRAGTIPSDAAEALHRIAVGLASGRGDFT